MAKKTKAAASGSAAIAGIDLGEVERLLAFMQKHGLEEFEYEREGVHIRLRKGTSRPASGASHAGPAAEFAPHASSAAPVAHASSSREHAAEAAPASDLHVIKSPIVGTYYSAAAPGAEPFVAPGAKVDPGQVLCIIEAMKLMNEIESDVAGEVVQIFVENGHPVEYGAPLFGIRASKKK